MAQLDFTTLFTIVFCCLNLILIYYSLVSLNLLTNLITIHKFRSKLILKIKNFNVNFTKLFLSEYSRATLSVFCKN